MSHPEERVNTKPATVVALTNQKGGVGKTTTTRNLARAGQRQGWRVLVVDADPQHNLSEAIGAEELPEDVAGLADALSARTEATLADVIVPTIWEGVDLVPAGGDVLEAVRDELVVAGAGRESRLRQGLEAVRADYDVILIDCRPALDQLTVNALTAADVVAIVTNPELFSANGIAKLRRTIEAVREHYNPGLRIGGVLINHHEQAGTIQTRHWVTELSDAGLPVLEPAIPRHTWIGSANAQGVALDELHPAGEAVAEIYAAHLATLIGAHS
jgi:chromosome partitioning protein